MRFGFALRLMGAAANAEVLRASAELAEEAGLDALWVPDHIAIPPDDAEGSGGRYLDPLTSLAWIAAATERQVGAVRVDLHRARKRLAAQLRQVLAEFCTSEEEFEEELRLVERLM